MSDHIPFEIQSEIIKRLPVKSVAQCRSVSKLWKSLIHSSEFISSYHTCKTQPRQHLFIRYKLANELKYVSVLDDDSFPNHKSSLTVPQPVSQLGYILTLTSVNGLLCFFGSLQDVFEEKIAVLWNPSVGKAVGIPLSNSLRLPNGLTFIGFGVCPNTSDPKLVRINTIGYPTVNWEVEVFMLSTRVWKSVSNIPPAFRTCDLTFGHVFVDVFIYWPSYDNIKLAVGIRSNLIISFDLMSDEFGEVCLPGKLVRINKFTISKVYESLGLFEYYNEGETRFCDVWIMKEGVTKSFTKMLSIKAPDSWVRYRVLVIRNNGEAIIENIDDTNYSSVLEVYDPSSGRISGLGINGYPYSFSMNSYMETLLLLDQPLGLNLIATKQVEEAAEIWVLVVINEMCGAVICDACESACHLKCLQFNSKPISGEDWHCLNCVENSNGKPFSLKYGHVVRIASKPEMSSSSARVQQSIENKVQSSNGNNNQKKMSSVTDALLNPLSQNGIKLECNQEDDMREDEEDVEWVGDNFVKTSETCTVVEKNEGTVSSSMHDVEWVGDKLNEADGKTYYRSCCINGTTYQLQHYALFSSNGKNLVPGKLQEMWEDSKTNKKWVTLTRYFFPDDLPERVCHPCAPETNKMVLCIKTAVSRCYLLAAILCQIFLLPARLNSRLDPEDLILDMNKSVNLPFELLTSEARRGGSNASTNSHLGKHSTVQHHMNLIQAPTHEEIAKIVQNIVNAHMPKPDHKTWTVPSTNDCMNKNRFLERHCLKCLENSSRKPFPPKYGRCVRNASKPEMSSSTARVQPSTEKKVQSFDGNNNQKKMSSVTDAL
ncbi:retrovirus-related pol polyprotein from transposon TNT 1-94 [Tanacetum coccineum]